MKWITVAAFFILAGAFGASTAFAQTQKVRATVPFNFAVGNKVLPAGTYTIFPVTYGEIDIQNGKTNVLESVIQEDPDGGASAKSRLVFDQHNGQYFLREVLCESGKMNVSFPTSKLEKQARMEEMRLHNTGSQVVVALK